MVLKPKAPTQPAPAMPPIGTGFMPDSSVTIHKKKMNVQHPQGPNSLFMESVETTEVRPPRANRPTPPAIMVRGRGGLPPMPAPGPMMGGAPRIIRMNSAAPSCRGPPRGGPLPPPFFDLIRKVVGNGAPMPMPPMGPGPFNGPPGMAKLLLKRK